MATRLKWVKAVIKEVNQDGTNCVSCLDNKCLKCSSYFIRLLTENLGKRSSGYDKARARKPAAPAGGALRKAVENLINSVCRGTAIDFPNYVDVLQKCSKHKDFESTKQVHDCIKKSGLEQNFYVASSLLKCYIGFGRMQNAQELFNKLLNKDIACWNVMIGGYAEHDQAENAIQIYKQLRSEGGQPTAVTYLSALKACVGPKALIWGKKIHSHIIHDGLQADKRVDTALVHMYAKCGSVDDARKVFDGMENRNVVTWNAMISGFARQGLGHESFSLFLQMQREGIAPNAQTYLSILNSNTDLRDLAWVNDVHLHAARSGLMSDLRVSTALVHVYAKCGRVDDARMIFDSMEKRDVISWNVMIGGLAQHGLGHEAFSSFLQMQREGIVPNISTYMYILNSNASKGALNWVKAVHSHAERSGLNADLRVSNALMHMYAKCGSVDDARMVFDRMEERDVISWNVMIGGLAQHGLGQEAFSLFLQMQREGFTPNSYTYVGILNPCSSTGALGWVKEVHAQAIKAGLDDDLRLGNAFVHMYAKSGSIADAKQAFDKMPERDVVSWNAMIGGLAQPGRGHEAFPLFMQMQREGFVPDPCTYVSLLNPCSSTGALEWVKEVHAQAVKAGLDVDLRVGNALVHMYAKMGSIRDARQAFDKMVERDEVSWNSIIGGLAHHGLGGEALQLFEEMKSKGVKLSGLSFVAILSGCSHAGLVDESRFQFVSMTRDHGIEPVLEHFNCVVDALGRAGHLEEAKLFVLNMPIKANLVTWKAFAGACRTYGKVELAEVAAQECLKLEPMDPSSYVLLSNIYAASGKWKKVSSIRSIMQERGIRKNPGRTWIEVDNKVHQFIVGDTSHPETREVYAKLRSLSQELKAEGYIPDTRLVLRNLDDEDKASALCSHSEKLAIAYGLMHVTPGKPIRIFKNLRMCIDCHTITKFLSKITGREIVARDANRFHHFREGLCTCGDYW